MRLVINLPPKSLESRAATICLPAYVLGREPSAQIICARYGQQHADKRWSQGQLECGDGTHEDAS